MHDERVDIATGEIVEDDTRVPNTLRRVDEDTRAVPRQSRDIAGIIAMVEDGQFNLDVSEDARELVQTMEAHAHANKGVAKGKITLTLDLQLANGIFVVVGGHTVKKPVAKRLGTPLFAREDGALGLNPAGQYRSLGHQGTLRDTVIQQPVKDI
jgi:hypothetical protein